MGDLTSSVPAATTTAEPAAAPRCRRVHFPDLVASPIRFPPTSTMAEEAEPPLPGSEKDLEEDRMDLLWEDFNEELLAMRRACCGPPSESSDGEESDSAAGRACFPVLLPSARAGGAGHYRRRAGTWVLLMRIFRRLFVVDKTVSARRNAASGAR